MSNKSNSQPNKSNSQPEISSYGIYVAPSKVPNAGYGVYANKDFKKGEVIERSPFLEVETPYNNELMHYVFQSHLNHDKSIVVFGYGSIYNHSLKPNVGYTISNKLPSDRLFTYTALKNIKKGDELFISYGSAHPINELIKQQLKPKLKSQLKPKSSRIRVRSKTKIKSNSLPSRNRARTMKTKSVTSKTKSSRVVKTHAKNR